MDQCQTLKKRQKTATDVSQKARCLVNTADSAETTATGSL